ncbi:hypothetical protein EDF22_1020 [Rathayibacter sp. PhB127]|nr:hypothetical protein [Rathayibacter sp. PhB127]ROS29284.1 hypothetical protein EDF22_1020 [Rathayibacter sp. PhB127]
MLSVVLWLVALPIMLLLLPFQRPVERQRASMPVVSDPTKSD